MRRRRKNGRRLALAMLILLLAAGLGLLTIRFQRIFMEYAVNVCDSAGFSLPEHAAREIIKVADSNAVTNRLNFIVIISFLVIFLSKVIGLLD